MSNHSYTVWRFALDPQIETLEQWWNSTDHPRVRWLAAQRSDHYQLDAWYTATGWLELSVKFTEPQLELQYLLKFGPC